MFLITPMPPAAALARPAKPPKPRHAPARAPETDAERRTRHLDMLREMAELGMQAARIAAQLMLDADPRSSDEPANPNSPKNDPVIAFARATSATRQAIALEARIAAGVPTRVRSESLPLRAPADSRRPALRQALRDAADAEPNRAARTQLHRHIDQRIDEELLDDPDHEIPLVEILLAISADLSLSLDPSRLSDEVLGLAPRNLRPPNFNSADPNPPGPEPPNID